MLVDIHGTSRSRFIVPLHKGAAGNGVCLVRNIDLDDARSSKRREEEEEERGEERRREDHEEK